MRTDTLDGNDLRPAPGSASDTGGDGGRTARSRAGWWVLLVAGGAALLAALGWGANLLVATVDEVDGWDRSEVPGLVEVEVDEPGALVVRSESPGAVRWGASDRDLEVSVRGPDGERVPVEDVSPVGDYRVPGRTGRAVARFDASTAGVYRVTVEGTATSAGEFAVGAPLWPGPLAGLAGVGALGLAGALAAAAGGVGLAATRWRDGPAPGGHATRATGGHRRRPQLRGPDDRRDLLRLAGYAGLTLGLTWVVWIPALTLLGEAGMPLVALGAFGPAVAAGLMVWAEGGRIRSWLRDRLRFRVAGRWYLAALTLPLLEPVSTTIVAVAHGAPVALAELPARVPLVLANFALVLVVGGGQEELGWRGYLLPRLQSQVGPLGASVAVGVLWAVWHLPLFTLGMSGYTYQNVSFALYLPILVALSVVFTWLFNHAGGSVVVVMLLHAAVNSWDSLAPLPGSLELGGQAELLSQVAVTVGYALVATVLLRTSGSRLGTDRGPTIDAT